MKKYLLFFLFSILSFSGHSQKFSPDSSASSDRILAGTFANDATFRTDYYFTQGGTVNLVHPVFQKSPVNKVLLKTQPGDVEYAGLRVVYDGFTPLRIADPFIRYGDRPYASFINTVHYKIQNNLTKKRRLTSAVLIGVIGPVTGAKGFQSQVHEWLDAPKPKGWDFQIANDLLLGYEIGYEKQVLGWPQHLELIMQSKANLGTLYTFGEAGFLLRTGKLNSYFQNLGIASRVNRNNIQKFQFYAQARVTGRLVGYNATMQGGLFNKSTYTLKARDISRAVAQESAGLVCAYKGISFESSVVWISPEFKNARRHKWMHFDIRFVI